VKETTLADVLETRKKYRKKEVIVYLRNRDLGELEERVNYYLAQQYDLYERLQFINGEYIQAVYHYELIDSED